MIIRHSLSKIDYAIIGFILGSLFLNISKEVLIFFIGLLIGRITFLLKKYFNID